MDSSCNFKEAGKLLQKEYDEEILIDFMDSYKIDNYKKEYQKCISKIKASDIVLIIMHGGLTHFKSFDSIIGKFTGIKKFFIRSGFDDENKMMLGKSGLSQREYQ